MLEFLFWNHGEELLQLAIAMQMGGWFLNKQHSMICGLVQALEIC